MSPSYQFGVLVDGADDFRVNAFSLPRPYPMDSWFVAAANAKYSV